MNKTLLTIVTLIALAVNGVQAQTPTIKTTASTNQVKILPSSQNTPFDSVKIEKVQIAKETDALSLKETQFSVTIKNNSEKAIEKFSLYIVAKEKGRTIPLAENEIRFEAKAGIEPKETKIVSVKTNSFLQKKWASLTLEEINKAEVAAELITVTFYREKEIKSNTANAKNAVPNDLPPAESLGKFEYTPSMEKFEGFQFPDKTKTTLEPYKFPDNKKPLPTVPAPSKPVPTTKNRL